MRKNLFLFGLSLIFALFSCSDKEKPTVTEEIKSDFSAVVTNDFKEDFWATVFEASTKFTVSTAWRVEIKTESDKEWISVDKTSGEAGECTLVFSGEENYSGKPREALVDIKSANSVVSFTVKQKSTDKDGNIPVADYPYFLTLNGAGSHAGAKASISLVKKDNSVVDNIYNGDIVSDPSFVIKNNNDLYICFSDFWGANYLEIVNEESFVVSKKLSFDKSTFIPSTIEQLEGDKLLIMGIPHSYNKEPYSMAIIDPSKESFIEKKINSGFPIRHSVRIGDKIIAGGDDKASKVIIFDVNDINTESFKEIADIGSTYKNTSDFVVDKNNNVWVLAKGEQFSCDLCCINLQTESVVKRLKLSMVSDLNTTSYTICNKGQYIYLRTAKAFYEFDIDNLTLPEEPVYEYLEHAGSINDLKMTKDGSLVFIDKNISAGKSSEVYELVKDANGVWKRVVEEGLTVGNGAKSIYIFK